MIEHRLVWNPEETEIDLAIEQVIEDIKNLPGFDGVSTMVVGVLAGWDGSLQYYKPAFGTPEKRHIRMVLGKGAVCWERGTPSLDSAEAWFDVKELVPEGVNFGGAYPVKVGGQVVGVIVVTGGDHKTFDHPAAGLIAAAVELRLNS